MVSQEDMYEKSVKNVTPLKVKPIKEPQARLDLHMKGDMVEVTFSIPRDSKFN